MASTVIRITARLARTSANLVQQYEVGKLVLDRENMIYCGLVKVEYMRNLNLAEFLKP